VRDVLFLKPHSLIRRRRTTVIEALEGEVETLLVEIDAYVRPRSPQQPWRIKAYDGSGTIDLVFLALMRLSWRLNIRWGHSAGCRAGLNATA